MSEEITRQIRIYGIVQGVGFRPTVSRHAATRGIRGNVCNKGPYVEIYAQGSEEAVEEFISDIQPESLFLSYFVARPKLIHSRTGRRNVQRSSK